MVLITIAVMSTASLLGLLGAVLLVSMRTSSPGERWIYPAAPVILRSGGGARLWMILMATGTAYLATGLIIYLVFVDHAGAAGLVPATLQARPDIMNTIYGTGWFGFLSSAAWNGLAIGWFHARQRSQGTTSVNPIVASLLMLLFSSYFGPSIFHLYTSAVALDLARSLTMIVSSYFLVVIGTALPFLVSATVTVVIESKVHKRFIVRRVEASERAAGIAQPLAHLGSQQGFPKRDGYREYIAISIPTGDEDTSLLESTVLTAGSRDIPQGLEPIVPRRISAFNGKLAVLRALDITPMTLFMAFHAYRRVEHLWPAYEKLASQHGFFGAFEYLTGTVSPLVPITKAIVFYEVPFLSVILLLGAAGSHLPLEVIFVILGLMLLPMAGLCIAYIIKKRLIHRSENFTRSCDDPVRIISALMEQNNQLLSIIEGHEGPVVQLRSQAQVQECLASIRIKEARQLVSLHLVAIIASVVAPMILVPGNVIMFLFTVNIVTAGLTFNGIVFYTAWQAIIVANIIVMTVIMNKLAGKLSTEEPRFNGPLKWAYVPYWFHAFTLFLGVFMTMSRMNPVLAWCLAGTWIIQGYLANSLARERRAAMAK